MMRILALLTNPLTAGSVLSAAACLASRSGPAEVELIYPRPATDPDYMPTEDVYTDSQRESFEASQDQLVKQLGQTATQWTSAGLPPLKTVTGKPCKTTAEAAAAADLVILGTPHGDLEANAILETLLFEVEKPVLLVPRTMPRSFGQHIAIAWQPGHPAVSRAVGALEKLLPEAQRVIILMGDHDPAEASPPEVLLGRLREAGKSGTVHHFPLAGRQIGEALLSEARKAGADLLVMGAFSHSRLREFIFGGATIEILRDFDLPVLMQH